INSKGKILRAIEHTSIEKLVSEIKKSGVGAIAISLMNSYRNTRHEELVRAKLKENGFRYMSTSSALAKEIGILSRAQTSVVNAYLSEIIEAYLLAVKSKINEGSLKIMTSSGGLVDSDLFLPKDSLLSGPAGGVVGSAKVAVDAGYEKILSFDMGGTSTDVSRFAGKYDYKFISEINKISIFSPTLAIETVAAGGGSICAFDGYKLTVGPESAGASPGPACYGNEGPLAVTDINLLLGRIDNSNFTIPLNRGAARIAFNKVRSHMKPDVSDEDILLGFLKIANEKMAEAIRKISISKGYDPSEYALLAFGGAGGQHSCSVANLLEIQRVIIPYDAGLLSAYGIGNAEIERFVNRQILQPLHEVNRLLENYFYEMERESYAILDAEGLPADRIYTRNKFAYLRFKGQENTIEIEYGQKPTAEAFKLAYEKRYGHWLDNDEIEIESIKLIAASLEENVSVASFKPDRYQPEPNKKVNCYVSGKWQNIPAFTWEQVDIGAVFTGPVLLMSNNSTVYVEEDWSVAIDKGNNAILTKVSGKKSTGLALMEMAELELFTNRFKSVADDMGAILQRTSFSVNVKDRMDFSCALLNAKGYLVANAPHIPVHLGSLGVCVRKVMTTLPMEDGDVVITNHPGFGGSHLPDVTLIAPVFHENQLIAFVANRAHHAELGGKTPGSMPADASCLGEEGVVMKPASLVKRSKPNWDDIKALLAKKPYPSRAIDENLADLNGALASIKTGIDGILALCNNHRRSMVLEYMEKLLEYSGVSLFNTFKKLQNSEWNAEEFLDDGSKIKAVIKKDDTQIIFDFSGTSSTHPGNLNANLAILNSAVVYVLRLMMEEPLPLNEGIMRNVKIVVPECMLNPVFDEDPMKSPAVVGGNTETSQRIVDTLIKALRLAACSQGTMNNLIFGNDHFGFYETIGGGVGAGCGFDGADAVHQHMTNTRITDPEVMEFRYPVLLEEMKIRKNSGGKGKWNGGNGIVRQIKFEENVILTILSQHRKEQPFGMDGGLPGKAGSQVLIRSSGEKVKLKGIETIEVKKGDVIRIETPGGGGYG
ncbi:MAG: hydantoinase B/oxoprolinase family protein, partial [Cyclobacteriaceae bacterium]|nr:hydantoinase B/oxoprolinase family protein [Cyclobacteriaceae bacterium]